MQAYKNTSCEFRFGTLKISRHPDIRFADMFCRHGFKLFKGCTNRAVNQRGIGRILPCRQNIKLQTGYPDPGYQTFESSICIFQKYFPAGTGKQVTEPRYEIPFHSGRALFLPYG